MRITLGVAQGLAFGADLPLVGVSNLQALAQGAHRHGGCERVLAAIDARMDEIYVGGFALEQGVMIETLPEQVLAPKDFWPPATNAGSRAPAVVLSPILISPAGWMCCARRCHFPRRATCCPPPCRIWPPARASAPPRLGRYT
ncbi:hypothetical protein MBH78_19550 [Oceanimonas sp. NS1]|nr:hypothetical protein [Oceanimonas sp. NS1]